MQNPTIFLDIDGTLLKHRQSLKGILCSQVTKLDGTDEKLKEWESEGCKIILTTGRPESMRNFTEKELTSLGIYWDQLIMGIGGGPRYIVNDRKSNGTDTAFAINLDRNNGIGEISV